MVQSLRAGNMVLAFVVELAALAAVAYWAWWAIPGHWMRYVLVVFVVISFVALWSLLAAPRSPTRLKGAGLATLKALVFAVSGGLLWATGQPGLALTLWLGAVVTVGLELSLGM